MKKYNVSDINSGFHGEIHEIDNKFIVKANSVISTKFNAMKNSNERKQLVTKLETEGNLSNCAQTTKDVEFNSLAEAAKAICLDDNWERHVSEILDYETIVRSKDESYKNKETSDSIVETDDIEDNKIYKDTVKLIKDIFYTISKLINKKSKSQNNIIVSLDDESKAYIESVTKAINNSVEFNKEKERSLITQSYKWNSKPNNSEGIGLIGYDFSIIDEALDNPKKAVIIEGVPGTGKTKMMMEYAKERSEILEDGTKTYRSVTFHQGFQYIDFIGGEKFENGKFRYIHGVFTDFCQLADQHPDKKFYFLIDEFSRGEVSSIFGELMTAICNRGTEINLCTGRTIVVPNNLYIIASMNQEDANTTKIDLAVYQRFQYIVIEPKWTEEYKYELLKTADKGEYNQISEYLDKLFDYMNKLNDRIREDENFGSRYMIGTRDITIDNLTVSKLKNGVNNGLLATIDRVIGSGYRSRTITDVVRDIKKTFE